MAFLLLHPLLLVLSSALLFQQVCLFKAVWQSLADLNQSTPAFFLFLSCSLLCLEIHFQYSQEDPSLFHNCCTEPPVACMSNMLNTPLFLFNCPPSLPTPTTHPPSVSCAAAVIAASKANVFIETKGDCHWFATCTHIHAELTNSRVTDG